MIHLLLAFLLLPFSIFAQGTEWDDGYFFENNSGITITAAVQTSQQIAVIEKDEIQRRNAVDLASLLQDTLNINVNSYGAYGSQSGITIRGFDSKRLAFLINGVPADSSTNGKFDISQIDLNSVERIEVIYGGSDSRFNVSGALGGVVNIITVKKQPPGWKFSGLVSNTSSLPGEYRGRGGQTQSAHWVDLADAQNVSLFSAYGGEDFSFSANIFANRAQNHYLFRDSYNYPRRMDNNEVWDAGANISAVRELENHAKIIASSSFYYGDKNFPASGFSAHYGKQKDFSSRQSLMLEAPRAFRDDLGTEVSLSWNFNRLDYSSAAEEISSHDLQNINFINRWNWYPGEKLTLRSGFDYRFSFVDSSELGNRNRHDGGVYLTAELKPANTLLVIPSAKAVFSSGENVNAAVIPKLGLLWNVSDSLAIKNNYFRSFKFPDFEELYWSGGGGTGNPNLLPEDGWGADIGAELQIKKAKLESVFFAQSIKNSIHWYYSNSGSWRPENVGEAVFLGLDNKISFEMPVSIGKIKKIAPSLSYKYLRSYLLSFGYNFESDKRIPYNPEHTIGGSVDVFWDSGSFVVSGHYESLRYHDRANLIELEPYLLLNAAVNQNINENICLFGSLRNMLNKNYESFYDYPMPGISLTLGMRFNMEKK